MLEFSEHTRGPWQPGKQSSINQEEYEENQWHETEQHESNPNRPIKPKPILSTGVKEYRNMENKKHTTWHKDTVQM